MADDRRYHEAEMPGKEIAERSEGMLRSFDDKIDAATHAAFNEMGLSVAGNMDAAYALNDYLTQAMNGLVTSDTSDS